MRPSSGQDSLRLKLDVASKVFEGACCRSPFAARGETPASHKGGEARGCIAGRMLAEFHHGLLANQIDDPA
jgi:hypothetical protein